METITVKEKRFPKRYKQHEAFSSAGEEKNSRVTFWELTHALSSRRRHLRWQWNPQSAMKKELFNTKIDW